MIDLEKQGRLAKAASYELASAGTDIKDRALSAIADILTDRAEEWLSANEEDLRAAEASGMKKAMLDRLRLTRERIDGIVEGVRQVKALPDPIGHVDSMDVRPNGLIIGKKRVPLGVIGIIYEARPNVTVDAAVLCLKSGNVCILRGGSEAIKKIEAPKFLAAISETAGQFAYIYALSANAILSAPLISAYCVLSMVWSRIFLKEKLTKSQYAAIATAVAGIILLGIGDA